MLNQFRIRLKAFWMLGISLMFLTSVAFGQTVTGTVTDAETGVTMPGVNISVQGTQIGTSSDADGEYSLDVPSLDGTLVFSFVGYETVNEPINGRQTVNIEMTPAAVVGEDVVVIGYGTQRSEDVTGSVGVVDNENISSLSVSSPEQVLQGQIAGVTVQKTTGVPGSGAQVRIRGVSSAGSGVVPLYVVDGFALPQPNPNQEQAANYRSPLSDIPASDIESITVLKDASATAIYGSRASNGVVVIETKSGSAGARQINVNVSTSVSQDIERMKFDMANAEEYASFWRFIWEDRMGAGTPLPDVYANPQNYNDTEWFETVRQDNAITYDANVSISGGNESIRSYFSANVRSDQGVIKHTSFDRVSLRANLEASLSDKLTVGLNLAPSYTKRNLPDVAEEGRGSVQGSPMMMSPLGPAYVDGELTVYPQQHVRSPGTWQHPNPLYVLENLDQSFDGIRGIGTAFMNYQFIEGLTARASANVDWGISTEEYFSPSTFGGINSNPPVTPIGYINDSRDNSLLGEITVNFNRELGPGTLDALAGYSVQTGYDYTSQFNGEFPDDEIRTLNVASDLTGSSIESEWSMMSWLGRANYNLLNRYIFTATFRTDGSSRFGSENRWGSFPSAAVAWNMHNEEFFNSEIFDELRMRGSYGFSGNNQIGNYSALGTVEQADYMFNNGSVAGGRKIVSLANPNLTWERLKEVNLGVDASLLNYRMNLTVDWYNRTNSDMLLERNLPTSSGFDEVTENLGDMETWGLEVTLNTVNVQRDDFSWFTDLNWSMYRNEITSLPNGAPIYGAGAEGQPAHITRVGDPMALHLGHVVPDGYALYTPEQIADSNVPKYTGAIPGNLIFLDVNGDGQITPGPPPEGDFAVIGNPHPDWTFGMVNTISYKNWDFRFNVTGSIGHEINRREHYRTALNIDGLFNVAADYANNFYRSEAEPGDGRHPTPLGPSEARTRYRGQHTLNIYDGTNVWVRNVTLRYNLPSGFAGTQNSNVYMSVDNPWIITSYPGNPEAQDNSQTGNLSLGRDFTSYPLSTSFSLGLEIGL
ncbi:MAG: TonB-dependent receptor [Balneolaceae bacterium]|nr:TonB-dependent receptor [Balneolaceae bacterium]